jgi:hypothetical protein
MRIVFVFVLVHPLYNRDQTSRKQKENPIPSIKTILSFKILTEWGWGGLLVVGLTAVFSCEVGVAVWKDVRSAMKHGPMHRNRSPIINY